MCRTSRVCCYGPMAVMMLGIGLEMLYVLVFRPYLVRTDMIICYLLMILNCVMSAIVTVAFFYGKPTDELGNIIEDPLGVRSVIATLTLVGFYTGLAGGGLGCAAELVPLMMESWETICDAARMLCCRPKSEDRNTNNNNVEEDDVHSNNNNRKNTSSSSKRRQQNIGNSDSKTSPRTTASLQQLLKQKQKEEKEEIELMELKKVRAERMTKKMQNFSEEEQKLLAEEEQRNELLLGSPTVSSKNKNSKTFRTKSTKPQNQLPLVSL